MASELTNSQFHDSTVNANVSGNRDHYENCNIFQTEKDRKSDDRISAIIPAIVKHSEKNISLADENKSLKREIMRREIGEEKLRAELERKKIEEENLRRKINTIQEKNYLEISNNLLAGQQINMNMMNELSYSLKLQNEMSTPRKCRSLSNYSSRR